MHLLRRLGVFVFALVLLVSSAPQAHAALSGAQIEAILSLLSSFGTDASLTASVAAALSGQPAAVIVAQNTIASSGSTSSTLSCPNLTRTLGFGSRDSTSRGEVSKLQQFLASYYGVPTADLVTGVFGRTTESYVKRFQREKGITATGIVGLLTRSAIAKACVVAPPPPSSAPACSISAAKPSYTLGETITFNWTSTNATYAAFIPDTSGKDALQVPGDKLPASGSQQILASVYGSPSVTLGAYAADNTVAKCIATVSVVAPSVAATITASPSSGALSGVSPTLWVDFKVNNYTPTGGEIIDFGDGTKAALGYTTATDARHDYHTAGTFMVILKNAAGTSIASTQVVVSPVDTVPGNLVVGVDAASTPVNTNVAAGSNNLRVGAFKFSSTNLGHMVEELMVRVPGGETNVARVTLSYQDVNGMSKTASQALVYPPTGTFAYAQFTGLDFYIPGNSSRTLLVLVDIVPIASGATSGAKVSVLLDGNEGFSAIDGAKGLRDTTLTDSGADLRSDSSTGYGTVVIRKSFPTITTPNTTSTLSPGTTTIAQVMVQANPAGDIDWARMQFSVGKSNNVSLTNLTLWKNGSPVGGAFTPLSCTSGSTKCVLTFTPSVSQTVSAGATVSYDIRATVGGLATGANTVVVSIEGSSTSAVTGTISTVSANGSPSLVWSDWSSFIGHASNPLTASDWTNDYLVKYLPLTISTLVSIY